MAAQVSSASEGVWNRTRAFWLIGGASGTTRLLSSPQATRFTHEPRRPRRRRNPSSESVATWARLLYRNLAGVPPVQRPPPNRPARSSPQLQAGENQDSPPVLPDLVMRLEYRFPLPAAAKASKEAASAQTKPRARLEYTAHPGVHLCDSSARPVQQ